MYTPLHPVGDDSGLGQASPCQLLLQRRLWLCARRRMRPGRCRSPRASPAPTPVFSETRACALASSKETLPSYRSLQPLDAARRSTTSAWAQSRTWATTSRRSGLL